MDYTTLGRTGLKVSVVGVGGGGPSRLGQRYGISEKDSMDVVKIALESGINFIDTAEVYRTEGIVGKAITESGINRKELVISTKKSTWEGMTEKDIRNSIDRSLKLLKTDYVDIYHLHAVIEEDYDNMVKNALPVLQDLKNEGKIRFIGITERFNPDPSHKMLQRALQDDYWDVMMVGHNILNQSAREKVFSKTIEKNIGVLIMFAVRLALSKPERLKECISELVIKNQIDQKAIDPDDPLGFLLYEGGATSLPDAAYRYCRFEPGVHVTLCGTGNPSHMKDNIDSFSKPPLPKKDVIKINEIFRNVDSISGQ